MEDYSERFIAKLIEAQQKQKSECWHILLDDEDWDKQSILTKFCILKYAENFCWYRLKNSGEWDKFTLTQQAELDEKSNSGI